MRTGTRRGRTIGRMTTLTLAAGLMAACGGGSDDPSSAATSADPNAPVTLTVATFNEFGYDELIAEYMKANPNVKVEHKKAATANEARDNLNTRLAAGSGLSDIEAVEVDWLPELKQYPDQFVDLASDSVKDRWVSWKTEQATTSDGKLIGYGTDIGPEAICYRSDLFAKAGLPTDRDEVSASLGGSWDDYFALGEKFTAKSDVPWMESAGAIYQAMVNRSPMPMRTPTARSSPPRTPRSRLCTTRSSRPPPRDCPPISPSGATTGPAPSSAMASPPWSARAGCWASSRATRRASRVGTSPTPSPAVAATGVARS